ncbi:MAG: N-acetyltransferase [Gemmatimonadota bacterium]|nr:MAG: N-acetyltransferase [Gemmatimonadota bacterium]
MVRSEEPGDFAAIRQVTDRAFGQPAEGRLVDRLRGRVHPWISLVKERQGRVLGHVLFTPVTLDRGEHQQDALALGPMSVDPDHQQQGIGTQLVRAGLDFCRERGHELVFVLGHPTYYPRFGFVPTVQFGIRWEHPAPEEVFLLAELKKGAAAGKQGVVRYHPEFEGV